jgi:hypothetical protein
MTVARRQRRTAAVADATARFDGCLTRLQQQHRRLTARYLAACRAAAEGMSDDAAALLGQVVDDAPTSFVGWTIPIDPFLRPLRGHAGFAAVLSRLASRAH